MYVEVTMIPNIYAIAVVILTRLPIFYAFPEGN